MRRAILVMPVAVAVLLVEPLGAVGSLELMALAGNAKQRNGRNQQGEEFHRGAS